MRTPSFVMIATVVLGWCASAASAVDPKPNDATLGLKPPADARVLFDGEGLRGWVKADGKNPADWPVEDGILTVGRGSIETEKTFGDFQLHVEFNVPYMPKAKGQARGNSGVYLAGTYEIQVLDSYHLPPKDNECGAIYSQVAPSVNACKPPLQWQSYDVVFRKARVEDGKVVKKARVTVVQNGIKIIEDAEVSPTPGGDGTKEGEDGPILLQDHGNPVQYRNIWIKPLD
ncbi:MAG: DUF1080 domain-containing protein [Planctomycetaceae bacterium]|nr:DUF1080 domain-containing protein [Planctomycetaceae bacterium]